MNSFFEWKAAAICVFTVKRVFSCLWIKLCTNKQRNFNACKDGSAKESKNRGIIRGISSATQEYTLNLKLLGIAEIEM